MQKGRTRNGFVDMHVRVLYESDRNERYDCVIAHVAFERRSLKENLLPGLSQCSTNCVGYIVE